VLSDGSASRAELVFSNKNPVVTPMAGFESGVPESVLTLMAGFGVDT
jgi:hypothetical protein